MFLEDTNYCLRTISTRMFVSACHLPGLHGYINYIDHEERGWILIKNNYPYHVRQIQNLKFILQIQY